MSRPFCPSTSLISVWAATTPSSPGLYGTVIGTQVYAPPKVATSPVTSLVVVAGVVVRLDPWVHVDVDRGARHGVRHLVLHLLGDRVRVLQGDARVEVHVHDGDQLAAHPPGAHVVDPQHAIGVG